MKMLWKVLLTLALLVPMGAYVAGSLVASAAEDPAPRPPIVIEDPDPARSPTGSSSTSPDASATPDATPPGTVGEVEVDPDDIDDPDDDWGRDDDHDGGHHGDDSGGEHSGSGGGGDGRGGGSD